MSKLNMTVEGTELVIRVDVSKLAQMNAPLSNSKKTRILANARFEKVECKVCPGLQVNAVILCAPEATKAEPTPEPVAGDTAAIAVLAKLGLGADQIAKLLAKATPTPAPTPVMTRTRKRA